MSDDEELLPPIDHYSFYLNRYDLINDSDALLNEKDIESYRDQIVDFEQKLAFGPRELTEEQKNKLFNNEQTFCLDHEAALIYAHQNAQDKDSTCSLNDQDHIDEKIATIQRDILHKPLNKPKSKKTTKFPDDAKFYTKLSEICPKVAAIQDFTSSVEVGHLASLSVSSCKSNHGVKNLRDLEFDTYWQSEGQQPHFINFRFNEKITFSFLRFYIDESADESYTPATISIRIGTNEHELTEIINQNIQNVSKQQEGCWIYCSFEKSNQNSLQNVENLGPKVSTEPFVDDPYLSDWEDDIQNDKIDETSKKISENAFNLMPDLNSEISVNGSDARTDHTSDYSPILAEGKIDELISNQTQPEPQTFSEMSTPNPPKFKSRQLKLNFDENFSQNVQNSNFKTGHRKHYHSAFFLQLAILTNHQNGRDTHIRQVQIFSPKYFIDKKFKNQVDRQKNLNRIIKGKFRKEELGNCNDFKIKLRPNAESKCSKESPKYSNSSTSDFDDEMKIEYNKRMEDFQKIDLNNAKFEESYTNPKNIDDYFKHTENFKTDFMKSFSSWR